MAVHGTYDTFFIEISAVMPEKLRKFNIRHQRVNCATDPFLLVIQSDPLQCNNVVAFFVLSLVNDAIGS